MKLNVLYFAHVRAVVGRDAETLEVGDDALVSDAVEALCQQYPRLRAMMRAIRVAVDGEFAALGDPLRDGAELVLIPPVAGGAGPALPAALLTDEVLDGARQRALEALVRRDADGAVVTFAGVVRDHARGRAVTRLVYEAYPSMAQRQLDKIVAGVEAQWPGTRVAVHHRTGTLEVGDTAVLIAVASTHRAEAFDACRAVIDRIKADVPIWKREIGPDGEDWVSDRP
jgi:molybdopterin synthase catalytic subunit